jgi:hypothetical protein
VSPHPNVNFDNFIAQAAKNKDVAFVDYLMDGFLFGEGLMKTGNVHGCVLDSSTGSSGTP